MVYLRFFLLLCLFPLFLSTPLLANENQQKKLAYIVSDLSIPYWQITQRGILSQGMKLAYAIQTYNSSNSAKKELEAVVQAINDKVDGIIISPTSSSACATVLKLAKEANIPVVICDIGTQEGEYVSYISSDNKSGAYQIGKVLADFLKNKVWQEGRVGIIAIPQKRINGKERTAGFMQALEEAGIKGGGIKQQITFSYEETYEYAKELIANTPDLRAIWLQGSDKYKGALQAIKEAKKQDEIALLCFDAEPEFLEMIPRGEIVVVGMQQPFLMGEKSVQVMYEHLLGNKVKKNIQLPILSVDAKVIEKLLPTIKRNVLGMDK